MSIKPTVGRVVLYNPLDEERDDIRHAAIVVMVHSDECVNLVVFDANGVPYHRQSVVLIQDPIVNLKFGECELMPYQHGQAAKTETVTDILVARINRLERMFVDKVSSELGELVIPPVLKEDAVEFKPVSEYVNEPISGGEIGSVEQAGNVVDLKPNDDDDEAVTDDDLVDAPDGTDESTDDAGTGEGTETEANALGEAAVKSAALSGLMAHALEVELESINLLDTEGEPVKLGEKIHEAEYTFVDGVSFVVDCGEHLLLQDSGLSPG